MADDEPKPADELTPVDDAQAAESADAPAESVEAPAEGVDAADSAQPPADDAQPLGPPPPPDYDAEIAEIVAELMDERARTKERDIAEAAARRARLSRRGLPLPVQITIVVLVSVLVVWPPPAFLPQPDVPVYPMMQGARVQVWLIANDIERFRAANGRLPDSLSEIQRSDHGVAYQRAGNQYTLVFGSPSFQWRSDEPMTRILSGVPNSLVPQTGAR
ncbi:MAG TPA: hypothetical protein VJR92_15720 [Gemmatimonadaceae bacterium]|nr:hypothetical protein [Gemmatimonadaceae bacterium]